MVTVTIDRLTQRHRPRAAIRGDGLTIRDAARGDADGNPDADVFEKWSEGHPIAFGVLAFVFGHVKLLSIRCWYVVSVTLYSQSPPRPYNNQ